MASPTSEVPPNSFSATARKVLIVGADGQPAGDTKTFAQKVVTSGSDVYVCLADPGTAEASALWRIYKQTTSSPGNFTITWADGNSKFDNVATDPTALTYS